MNLYAFCGNSGVNRWDLLGMFPDDVTGYGTGSNGPSSSPLTLTSNPWVSNGLGVLGGGLLTFSGGAMIETPFAPVGAYLMVQGISQTGSSIANLSLLATGTNPANLIENSGAFSLANASINIATNVDVHTNENFYKWVDYGSTMAATGLPGIEETSLFGVKPATSFTKTETTIGIAGAVDPFLPKDGSDGLRTVDPTIYPTAKAAAAGNTGTVQFSVPNVRSSGSNGFSNAFYGGLYNSGSSTGNVYGKSTPGALQLAPFVITAPRLPGSPPPPTPAEQAKKDAQAAANQQSISDFYFQLRAIGGIKGPPPQITTPTPQL